MVSLTRRIIESDGLWRKDIECHFSFIEFGKTLQLYRELHFWHCLGWLQAGRPILWQTGYLIPSQFICKSMCGQANPSASPSLISLSLSMKTTGMVKKQILLSHWQWWRKKGKMSLWKYFLKLKEFYVCQLLSLWSVQKLFLVRNSVSCEARCHLQCLLHRVVVRIKYIDTCKFFMTLWSTWQILNKWE